MWQVAPEKSQRSIWDVDYSSMAERIDARRDRISKRIEAAKRLTRMMKIQKMMGFKGEILLLKNLYKKKG